MILKYNREIFGTSEDEIPEFDHSEDAENGSLPAWYSQVGWLLTDCTVKELETLNRESQMLQKIRQSIGSPEFAQQVFHKVFTDDINRLRSMEDMWKTRTPPEPLNFGNILADSEAIDISISSQDQQPWTLTENFVVFLDRYLPYLFLHSWLTRYLILTVTSLRRLSERAMQQKRRTADGISPLILSFDKDDEDSLDFVAATANLRSLVFGIDPRSKFDIKQMAGNIIPAIATTNAMTAGLCVLQAFKVLRDQLGRAKMVKLNIS